MNLPSPVNTKPKLFNDIQQKIASIYLNLADDPVKYTANELFDKQGHQDFIEDKVANISFQ